MTLVYDKGSYSVGGIVAKEGKPAVEGVQIGDKILSIDETPVEGWSRDQIFSALHGKAGDRHRLSVERDRKNVTLSLPVTLF